MSKFKIPIVPRSTQKTIRFPNWIVEEVEDKIRNPDCSFSAFVVEAVRTALRSLE